MPAQGGGGGIEIGGHTEGEGFVHDDGVGITAVGLAAGVFVRGVVGEDGAGGAELFVAIAAVFAGAAGIHQAAHGGEVADLEFFDAGADFDDAAEDFVAGHAGIGGAVPFVAGDMDIGVADAAVQDLDLHVLRAGLAALDDGRGERRGCVQNRISFGVKHRRIFSTGWGKMQKGP
jgi:hypothetical protein